MIFGIDLLIRVALEQRRFCSSSRRWWNLADSLSLIIMLAAYLDGRRLLGNVAAFVRVARVLRLARCLWTFENSLAKWTHLRQLRMLVISMAEGPLPLKGAFESLAAISTNPR